MYSGSSHETISRGYINELQAPEPCRARYYIQVERKKKVSQSKIAEALGPSQGTISRELKRNSGKKGYRHKQADRFAHERLASKTKAVKMTEEMKYIVSVCILNDWSPEQISSRLHEEGMLSVHHETIYKYVLTDKKNGDLLSLRLMKGKQNCVSQPLCRARRLNMSKKQ